MTMVISVLGSDSEPPLLSLKKMEAEYHVVDNSKKTASSSSEFSKDQEQEQRLALYKAEIDCNITMRTQPAKLTGVFCPRTWDRVMCWPDTAAGTTASQPCPVYIHGFDHNELAIKQCMENGTWYIDPEKGTPWTNFSACYSNASTRTVPVPPLIVQHMPGIKVMYTIGYSLSLAALVLAVFIMLYFRRLHCSRNMIHVNMFLAFLVRAAFSLLKTVLMVQDLGFPNDVTYTENGGIAFIHEGTHWACKLFFTLFYYIILASLMGLFNEGFYLVLILSVSVFAEKTKIRWFVLLGWGVPVVFVIPWVILRIEFDDMLCWNVHLRDDIFWILRGPMVASVAVNFAFFINIVRMLFTKLTASNCPESRKVRYRKLAKSTLILIPLFAVYYMGFIWLPDDLSPASELFKMYVEMLFNSFQGFLVALLFCFLNAEVQNEIRKKWSKHMLRRTGSWHSQPSMGSYFHRSTAAAPKAALKGSSRHHQTPQDHPEKKTLNCSILTDPAAGSAVIPPVAFAAATVVANSNIVLTPIGEEEVCRVSPLPTPPPTPPSRGQTSFQAREDQNDNCKNRVEFDVIEAGDPATLGKGGSGRVHV